MYASSIPLTDTEPSATSSEYFLLTLKSSLDMVAAPPDRSNISVQVTLSCESSSVPATVNTACLPASASSTSETVSTWILPSAPFSMTMPLDICSEPASLFQPLEQASS